MTYPAKIQAFIKHFNENNPDSGNKAYFEAESGDFYGFGYASPFEFITEVNHYLKECDPDLKPEDMILPEDARKRWAVSLDTPQDDILYLLMDRVTERTPFAFRVYHIPS